MNTSRLFEPLRMGAWELPNRVIMAPLTRGRASPGRVPNALMAEYYRQRASAGLIISEATSISPMAVGYPNTPGIWSDDQVEGWKLITNAVHAEGGRIILQLWHVGRISDPCYLDGALPVAPSALRPEGYVSLVRPKRPFVTPRALELEEIPTIVEDYRQAAENAKAAGFDGVEIHGANGYLLQQFLRSSTNHRIDAYGGAVENRARLMLEAVDAAVSVWGPDRVGLHLSPRGEGTGDPTEELHEAYLYVARETGRRGIAFLFSREDLEAPRLTPRIKAAFGGPVIANQGLTYEQAEDLLTRGEADAASWGVQYIANPDLPRRFREGAALNPADRSTFHGDGVKGYTDYPALAPKH
jgi:2,4-dienoyl-CoA reductase-like NADH-dependent reductase (Old Yellow Enzyme family)